MARGLFITFEGPEGAGKTTQIRRLATRLEERGISHIVTREPGGTPLADRIRALLLDKDNVSMVSQTELLLMLSARSEHVANKIRPALEKGQLVLCDRFSDSSVAYQGYGRGEDLTMLRSMNAYATGGLTPDLTLVCDLDVREGLARARAGREGLDRIELAGLEFHEALRRGFLELVEGEPERVKKVDAGQAPDEVTAAIWKIIEPVLPRIEATK